MRTSYSHPLQIAAVQVGPDHGRIGITFCPGKKDRMSATGVWSRDLDVDLDVIQKWGARLVLTLVEAARTGCAQGSTPGAGGSTQGYAMAPFTYRRFFCSQ